MRLALLNTPRSGSTWLRCLLGTTFGLEEFSAFLPEDVRWNSFPECGVLHLHAYPSRALRKLLWRHRIRPVIVRRHPIDVLISILHFAPHEPNTAKWLGGLGGDERELYEATPTSPAFMRYATSARARALLSVSPAWADVDDALIVSYERLAARPVESLNQIARILGATAARDPQEAVELHSLARHRSASRNQHYWRGQPGLWRRLVTTEAAAQIADSQPLAFRTFGYEADADPALTTESAAANWEQLRAA